ncbi:MAG: DUF3828 domain-containing protein [Prevotella sp.]|nr:DUF3828 domain-containing protein [Prevotella sp.]MBQ6161812.1 DUF3828 domain-containing protein [Prevotella sp.]
MRHGTLFLKAAFIMLAGIMISCGDKQQKPADASAVEKAEPTALDKESITNIVTEIYAIVGGEIEVKMDINETFCSKEWNKLVSEVNKNDEQKHNGEVGFFDCDYWLQAQDYGNVSITEPDIDFTSADNATVNFVLHNLGTETPMQLAFINENGKWVVDNIIKKGENAVNMKQEMKEYLSEEQKMDKQ